MPNEEDDGTFAIGWALVLAAAWGAGALIWLWPS